MGTPTDDTKAAFALIGETGKPGPGRLLERDFLFHQCSGTYNVTRNAVGLGSQMYIADWYHTLVHQKLYLFLTLAVFVYVCSIVFFAIGFSILPDYCEAGIDHFMDALFLSTETLFTIGYGTKDPFFSQCAGALVLIGSLSIWGTLLNGVLISLMFMRLSGGATRSMTILFSDKAVVRRVRGQLYFMFQLVELRKHQLANAKISAYAIRYIRGSDGRNYPFQYTTMRLQHPDDTVGSPVLLFIPAVVIHRIDKWSPLMPPSHKKVTPATYDPQVAGVYPDVFQRVMDADCGNRNGATCGICGSTFNSTRQLAHHMRFSQANDSVSGHDRMNPQSGPCNHLAGLTAGAKQAESANAQARVPTTPVEDAEPAMPSNRELQEYWTNCNLEVIVLLEGGDITSSFPVQARHSYYFKADEILFDHMFEPCLSVTNDGSCNLEFSNLHKTHPVPADVFSLDEVASQP